MTNGRFWRPTALIDSPDYVITVSCQIPECLLATSDYHIIGELGEMEKSKEGKLDRRTMLKGSGMAAGQVAGFHYRIISSPQGTSRTTTFIIRERRTSDRTKCGFRLWAVVPDHHDATRPGLASWSS